MRKALCVAIMSVVSMGASIARADLDLSFDLGAATLDFFSATNQVHVHDSDASQFDLFLKDTTQFSTVDTSRLLSAPRGSRAWSVDLNLQFSRLGVNQYVASGAFSVNDTTGVEAISGVFNSTSIGIFNGRLEIEGGLKGWTQAGPILVNKGTPWVFEGDSDVPIGIGDPDANVTVNLPDQYEVGDVLSLQFGLGGQTTLDQLFNAGQNRNLFGGEVKGQIYAPAPGAAMLAGLGLCTLAGLRRRFQKTEA